MIQRIIATSLLVSLFALVLWAGSSPILVLALDTDDTRLFCSAISSGDNILYYSINSIYRVPVEERLRVLDDGTFVIVEVVSTPDVVYYYGIESFTRIDDVMVRAVPAETRYRELRLKIGPRSQQRLVVRGQTIMPSQLAVEGTSVIVTARAVPRVWACR